MKPQATWTYVTGGCGTRDQIGLGTGARDSMRLSWMTCSDARWTVGKMKPKLADAHAAPESTLTWHHQSRRGRALLEPGLGDAEVALAGKYVVTRLVAGPAAPTYQSVKRQSHCSWVELG